MSKHNELRDRINELCPELKKLEFGCEVKPKEKIEFPQYNFPEKLIFLNHSGGEQIADTGDFFEYHLFLLEPDSGEIYEDNEDVLDNFEILGKDPTLEDVMMAIEKSNKQRGWFVNTNGEFSSVGYENLMTPPKISCKWITGKPLSSQSSETVEKILEILK
jgi:hypothetical protein